MSERDMAVQGLSFSLKNGVMKEPEKARTFHFSAGLRSCSSKLQESK